MGLVMALKPLHDKFNLKSITPVAYQAVSGSGTQAMDSLNKEIEMGDDLTEDYTDGFYSRPIAKNVIPVIKRLTTRVAIASNFVLKLNPLHQARSLLIQ